MGLIGVWVFIIACGSPNSAIREGIMISVGILSVILGRRPLPFNTLLLATWILYFHDPLSVFQLGTQLSIVATGAILAIVTHKGSMIMNVPIAAQITTSPFIASTFGTLPIYFLPINIACSIMFPVLALIIAMSFLYRACLNLASAMVNKAIYMLDG